MNKFKYLSLLALLAVLFGACEKVIDVELPDNEPLLVVESQISNMKDIWRVQLSSSQDYFEKDGQQFVDDAVITITDLNGKVVNLTHIADGLYESADSQQADVDQTYGLNINWKGTLYQASERCRPQLSIDTFAAYFLPDNNGFILSGWYAFIGTAEYPVKGDHYQWKVFKNDTLQEGFGGGYILDSDELVEFGYFNTGIDPKDPLKGGRLPRPIGGPYEEGDRVMVQQLAISKAYFDYLNDVSTQRSKAGSPFDAPAANPKGNITNNALGYFSVVNIQERVLVVE